MNVRHVRNGCMVAALAAIATGFGLQEAMAAQPGRSDAEEGVQVLTRGPVHEAFAETVSFDPEPGMVVPQAPPVAIEELPPEQRPEGTNVAWIPGYWGWDDERSDYLWVSGVWRDLPPSRQWVPGYWRQSGRGYQWVSGYWADAALSEVEYLPEPPATVEAGPNIAAASPDEVWLPGCWIWHQQRYVWRPGFWATAQPNWVWVPDRYVWAPRGYVFVSGYWDYAIDRRGVLFAPVYFDARVYSRPGYSYVPATVIDLGVFTNHLFLRPRYQHYYFGDYYAASYQNAGFYPWFSYHSSRYGYDPIYAHQRWQYRQDPQWETRVAADYRHRRDQEQARPPRTWADQRALRGSDVRTSDTIADIAAPFLDFMRNPNRPLRFRAMDQVERQELTRNGQEVQRFRQERYQLETAAPPPAARAPREVVPARVPLPRSPIVARPVTELGEGRTPPTMRAPPKPDFTVEPRPRVSVPAPPQRGGRPAAQGQPESPQRRGRPEAQSPSQAPQRGGRPAAQGQPQAPQREDEPAAQSPSQAPQRGGRPAAQGQPQAPQRGGGPAAESQRGGRPAPEPGPPPEAPNRDEPKDENEDK